MRAATRDRANGRVGEALAAYTDAGMVQSADSRDAARAALIDRWDAERRADPGAARLILTHMNKEVEKLNAVARERILAKHERGENVGGVHQHGKGQRGVVGEREDGTDISRESE